MIIVDFEGDVQPGREAEFEASVQQTWVVLKDHPGFYSGKVYRNIGNHAHVKTTEQWKSYEEYVASLSQMESHPLTAKIRACLVAEPSIRPYEIVSSTWQ